MATFYNQATLSYNGNTLASNVTTGEFLEALSATKVASGEQYQLNEPVTYVVNVKNSSQALLSGVTVTDDLGAYTYGTLNLVPLDYEDGSVLLFIDGTLQAAPTITPGPPLVISGIRLPAGSTATIVYRARVNRFAPLGTAESITNTATITAEGLTTSQEVSEVITPASTPLLSIEKSLSPTVVTDNGQITYTFTLKNTGSAPLSAPSDAVITDTFSPVLDPISVTFNDTSWTENTEYTYSNVTGQFSTVAGNITVPAAAYTRDPDTGAVIVTPGISTLVITGTI